MRTVIPCPSPNGTNRERLHLHMIREPDAMALDAALEPDDATALPDAGAQSAQAYEALCKFLSAKLDQRDLPEAEALLRQFLDASGGEGDGAMAGDEPEPFVGRPRPGGAMDSRTVAAIRSGRAQAQQYAFAQRYPNASRLRTV